MAKILTHQIVSNQQINKLKETVTNLVNQIEAAQTFIKEIERGNLDIRFEARGNAGDKDDDALALSLLSMRDQMKRIASEEKQRNWATEGLAKFVDILRSNNDDIAALGNVIISNIVKYLNANQGSLYILDDSDPSDIQLDLIACYAYDRKKHIHKRFGIGEGVVGQCVLEKGTVYMTNLPKDYLKITSGLGEALPKNLLIVPLLLNEKVYGAIELASFSTFEKHHRDFIEKLAESIA
ncbi:MAG TPA: GAF domain-containing protein, partial [Ohtaekwangia sp.]|nr:GAF domain-containing protein [Ohtaekwangia sp.]